MRLFIAINIPKKEKDRIYRAARPLRERKYPVRWVSPELFHLTLKFLGDVQPPRLATIERVVEEVAGGTGSFPMDMGGFGAFPTIRRPRVLWLGVEPSPALRCLKQDMEWGLSEHGFERETRAFHPHFTLGRVQSESGAGAFRGLDTLSAELSCASTVTVHRLDIMESHLSASGPRYEIVTSFPLKGPPGR
jgi:2'-5' RNA ligase